jgi:hypothetical protein
MTVKLLGRPKSSVKGYLCPIDTIRFGNRIDTSTSSMYEVLYFGTTYQYNSAREINY